MSKVMLKSFFFTLVGILISSCGGSGGGAVDPDTTSARQIGASITAEIRTSSIAPNTTTCPNGGIQIESGIDDNGNGQLEDTEVDKVQTVCHGANGLNALVKQSVEARGNNCEFGGVRLEVGIDSSKDGTLDDVEITETIYLCNLAAILTKTTSVAAGNICPTGGILFETGIDVNGDQVLNETEVDSSVSVTVCSGSGGLNALVEQTPEPSGVNCQFGGVRVDTGIDSNSNDELDDSEINATSYVCHSAEQGLSAGNAYGGEQSDSWGSAWDSDERAEKTWAAANAQCQSVGGRLPTLTELYRVSAVQAGEVGNSYTTNHLWSRTWWNETSKGVVRLTDGNVVASTDTDIKTDTRGYRCIWPSNHTDYFAANKCYGPVGEECWTTVGDRGAMNMDKYDRPPVSFVAAHDECNFVNAHMAHLQDFVENIRAGLPHGSSRWNWVADAGQNDLNFVVNWQGVAQDFKVSPVTQSWSNRIGVDSIRRFRCKGVAKDSKDLNYPVISNADKQHEFVAPNTHIKAIARASGLTAFSAAIDACTASGGHMAHPRDMTELVRAGMANSGLASNETIWLADRSRYDQTQVTKWSGVDGKNEHFSDTHSLYTTWATVNAGTTRQYRCVYYPQDPGYTPPVDSNCAGGFPCYQTSFGAGNNKPLYAADAIDRQKVTYPEAIDDCVAQGGRLPSLRQMTELIRSGLENGSDNWLWTSDSVGFEDNHRRFGNPRASILKWNGTKTDFEPIHIYNNEALSQVTWSDKELNTRNYRCVWTNELW